jgi:hypothetical protein
MVATFPIFFGAPPATSTASSEVRSRATYRCRRRPNTSWSSTSRPPRRYLVKGDIAGTVSKLKGDKGDVLIFGSPGLGSSLTQMGLVDEYNHSWSSPSQLAAGQELSTRCRGKRSGFSKRPISAPASSCIATFALGHLASRLVELSNRMISANRMTQKRKTRRGRASLLFLQQGTLSRNTRITVLNCSGLCSGAKWLTPGSKISSAPGMLRARYSVCSGLINSSCSLCTIATGTWMSAKSRAE